MSSGYDGGAGPIRDIGGVRTAKSPPRMDLAKDSFTQLRQISGAVYALDYHTSCVAVTGHQGRAVGTIAFFLLVFTIGRDIFLPRGAML